MEMEDPKVEESSTEESEEGSVSTTDESSAASSPVTNPTQSPVHSFAQSPEQSLAHSRGYDDALQPSPLPSPPSSSAQHLPSSPSPPQSPAFSSAPHPPPDLPPSPAFSPAPHPPPDLPPSPAFSPAPHPPPDLPPSPAFSPAPNPPSPALSSSPNSPSPPSLPPSPAFSPVPNPPPGLPPSPALSPKPNPPSPPSPPASPVHSANHSPSPKPPRLCPYPRISRESKEFQQEEPKLHTEGVSEFLTHYERSGYTEDSLRQFVVLDELHSEGRKRKRESDDGEGEDDLDEDDNESDEDDQDENNDSSDSYYDETDHSDSDVPDDEVEQMLEEGLSDIYKVKRQKLANGRYAKKLDPGQYENRRKLVLDEVTTNHFEMLPEGWVQVTHNTGIPIYLHKTTRVCTTAMPYFLGPGSARKHKVPVSAIPCLQYRKALDEEKREEELGEEEQTDAVNQKEMECNEITEKDVASNEIEPMKETCNQNVEKTLDIDTLSKSDTDNKNGEASSARPAPRHLPSARVETARENADAINMSHLELREYCQRLFRFKTIEVMRFKTWAERRKFAKVKKKERQLQRPSLPDGTKLITFPILEGVESASGGGRAKKEWIMNPNGKSYVCILHEYVQHALKKQPVYEFKDLENPATPYSATVSINKMKYGTGVGTSKKQAKAEAAKMTLEILIPEMRQKIENDNIKARGPGRVQHTDLSFFDDIKIEDPRVQEFCAKTTEPSPYAILLTCLKRNFGLSDVDIKYQVNTLRHQKNEFNMSVGNHSATVICKNKREGKQRASQSILQAMHPHINNWGSLLRLYGSRSIKTPREKKIEEQEITTLQNRASANQPNWAILEKLKEAMLKLEETRASVKPIGEFVPPDDVELPSTSSSNLNNVEL